MPRSYYVYIPASRTRRLYIGFSGNLAARMRTHRQSTGRGFTRRYAVFRLVYVEVTTDVRAAIAREKQIKGWSRATKLQLISSVNPTWDDLAEEWLGERAPRRQGSGEADPSLRSG